MTEFRQVTPAFAVAGQISTDDVARAAAEGFRTILNNRPEHESPDQPSGDEIAAAARAHGLTYRAAPFQGPPPPAIVAETATILEEAPGPVLAYCRTGTRSIMAWAMAQALEGALRPDEIIAAAAKAGYDLSGARGALAGLAPRA
ncbi:MAG: TIGR01244 family phosphatase [Hyphomonadaceae bacterium]|nr:TIGR01244 family phosphatase [Hyphomonadaceae bacterium]